MSEWFRSSFVRRTGAAEENPATQLRRHRTAPGFAERKASRPGSEPSWGFYRRGLSAVLSCEKPIKRDDEWKPIDIDIDIEYIMI